MFNAHALLTPILFSISSRLILIIACTFGFANSSLAASEKIIENPANNSQLLNDTWVVEYEADDFTDKVEKATITFIPKDFTQQAAFIMRCKPFYTNFKLEYVDNTKNLLEDGELPNASSNFAKHGFIYDSEQQLTVNVDGDKERYNVSVGGQKNYLSKSFKTKQKIQPEQLGMSFFYMFVAQEMPSFRTDNTTDDALDFNTQLKQAFKQQKNIKFTLKSENGWQRKFHLDTTRMLNTIPLEVLKFCVTKRALK